MVEAGWVIWRMTTMQGSRKDENVISIFEARKKAEQDAEAAAMAADVTEAFEDIMRRNVQNLERLRKERQVANKSVLRSYRIKN